MNFIPTIASPFGGVTIITRPVPIDVFVNSKFSGVTLSENWTSGGGQTITVGGNELRMVGVLTTKDATQYVERVKTGLNLTNGYSTLASFIANINFRINAVGSNGYGAGLMARSSVSAFGVASSLVGIVNFKDNKLELYGALLNGSLRTPAMASVSLTVAINTVDTYLLTLTLNARSASLYLDNLSGQTQTINADYGFGAINYNPLKPSCYRFAIPIFGDSDVSYSNYTVASNEYLYPEGGIGGNSIEVRYMADTGNGIADNLIAAAASPTWGIYAGGAMRIADAVLAAQEIISVKPKTFITGIGTNDGGNPGYIPDLQSYVTSLTDAGIDVWVMMIVNGGDPETNGTYNNLVKTNFPTRYIDTWTTGWNTMTIGNGLMADSLHPTAAGALVLSNIIKARIPLLFPN